MAHLYFKQQLAAYVVLAVQAQRKIISAYVKVFNSKEFRELCMHTQYDWSFSAGNGGSGIYFGFYTLSVLASYGDAILEPSDRIHFVGRDAATKNHMEGAVESRERAARSAVLHGNSQFPSVKDIRFTEYSYTLLSSI